MSRNRLRPFVLRYRYAMLCYVCDFEAELCCLVMPIVPDSMPFIDSQPYETVQHALRGYHDSVSQSPILFSQFLLIH